MTQPFVIVMEAAGRGRETVEQVRRAASACGTVDFEVVLCEAGPSPPGRAGDPAASRLERLLDSGRPPSAVVLGPLLEHPLAAARAAHRLSPYSQLIFVVTPEREEGLRRELMLAPRIGTHWSLASNEDGTLARTLEAAAQATRRRLHHRTTLDRVRSAMPAPPPADAREYRRLVLSDRYFTSILNHASEAILSTDSNGEIQSWNRGAERMLGYREAEIRGRSVSLLDGPGEPRLSALIRQVSVGESAVSSEAELRHRDGRMIAAELSVACVRDDQGGMLGVSIIGRDVTERRRAQAAIYAEKERLRVTLASIGDGVITTDAGGRVEYMNPVAEKLTGWSTSDAAGKPLGEVFRIENEYTRRQVENPVTKVLREGVIVGLANHTILISRDGTERPIDDSAAPICDEAGRLLGVVLIFRDVTESRAAERRLLESEKRFRQLADSMPQIIWTADPDGHVDYCNERWYEFTGRSREEGSDLSTEAILHPDDRARCRERWFEAVRQGTPYEIEYRFHDRESDSYRWFLGRALPVRNEAGQVVRWFGTSTDIDEAKRTGTTSQFLAEAAAAVAELMDVESTLPRVARAAVPAFADWSAVSLLDADGRPRCLEMTHVDPKEAETLDELAGTPLARADAVHGVPHVLRTGEPELVSEVSEEFLQSLARDEPRLQQLRSAGLRSYLCVPLLSKDRVRGTLSFATAESGRRYGQGDLAAAQDLARRVAVAMENAELYAALTEADRRKDEFLATLAHELRNPLAPIRMGLEVLRLSLDDPATAGEMLETMDSQVQQMVRLIDDLLDVSRITRGKLELRTTQVDLAEIVKTSVDAVRPLVDAAGHRLTVSLPDRPPVLEADPARLSQVLANLLNNAAKYTPAGGDIELAARRDNDDLEITVTDSGIGIPPELVDSIFEMFRQVDATLERSTSGLGIGLTLVRRLVEMHGGTVFCRSEGLGSGSQFIVRLPLRPTPVPFSREGKSAAKTLTPESCRVLVVDDNRDAADVLSRMLRMSGQDVHTAYDGAQAVSAAEAIRPELILMDIGMPKLNGYDAASRIRDAPWGKEVFLVALTGWGQEEDRRRSAAAGFDRHLVKPVELQALHEILAAVKAGSRS